jgi:hypothetical protein
MSDVNFINAYNEVILDNLTAIMKQNFMFQTQMKFLEERVSKFSEMEQKLAGVESDKANKQEEYSRLVGEKNNLATSHADKAQELLTKLKAWRQSTDARMPTVNSSIDRSNVA